MLDKNECLEVLSTIACDSSERAAERIKAIELLTKISDETGEECNGLVIIDDIE